MLTLFGTIIFVYFMWLVVKPLVARYMRRKFQQKVNDMFRQAMGGGSGGASSDDPFEAYRRQQHQAQQQARRSSRRKIFSRDEGEYIEFEEVHIQADYTSETSSARPGSGYTPREPQVSDAEWEDVV